MKKNIFTAIIGRANTGKSTLLNTLLGEKIAIVSDKPQTTRTKITGITWKTYCVSPREVIPVIFVRVV